MNDISKEDDKTYPLTINYFESTLNSKELKHDKLDSYTLKKDYENEITNLIETGLESKLLDDIKYETALADDILQSESNMNDFVNSFLTNNMNDQIVYSNQLPDEIFETEEEISNGFTHDLNKLTNDDLICKQQNSMVVDSFVTISENKSISLDEPIEETAPLKANLNEIELSDEKKEASENKIEMQNDLKRKNESENEDEETKDNKQDKQLTTKINVINSKQTPISSISLINSTSITISNSPINTTKTGILNPILTMPTTIATPITTTNLIIANQLPITTAIKIESNEAISKLSKLIKKKEKTSKQSLLEIEPEQLQNKRKKLWSTIVKKDIPKAYKSRLIIRKDILSNCKKLAYCCEKERKNVIGIPKLNKERSKKSNKEIVTY